MPTHPQPASNALRKLHCIHVFSYYQFTYQKNPCSNKFCQDFPSEMIPDSELVYKIRYLLTLRHCFGSVRSTNAAMLFRLHKDKVELLMKTTSRIQLPPYTTYDGLACWCVLWLAVTRPHPPERHYMNENSFTVVGYAILGRKQMMYGNILHVYICHIDVHTKSLIVMLSPSPSRSSLQINPTNHWLADTSVIQFPYQEH